MSNHHQATPYELGELRSIEALPHLAVYLHNGSDNNKRLAASAIIKLTESGVNCYSVVPFLIKNLSNFKPQVRQYTLKALHQFRLSKDYIKDIKEIAVTDEKDYNRKLATDLLLSIEKDGSSLFSNHSEPVMFNQEPEFFTNNTEADNQPSESAEKGFVYFIQEDFSGRIKIGKTKDIKQRLDTFNVKLPFNVNLIHYIESQNHHYTEKLFHIHFNDKLVNGEWFELNPEDIEWIKRGNYTKRITASLVSIFQNHDKDKNKQLAITSKQIEFLSSLLSNHRLMLTKPVSELNATEANLLIGYLYKGHTLPKDYTYLITTRALSGN